MAEAGRRLYNNHEIAIATAKESKISYCKHIEATAIFATLDDQQQT